MTADTLPDPSAPRRATTRAPIACVLLPELPIVAHHPDAADARGGAVERAVHVGRGTATRIRFCDRGATNAGVRVGHTLAAARARCATLVSAPLDDGAVARSKREVIAALLALTPRVVPDGPTRFWAEPCPLGEPSAQWCDAVREATRAWGPATIGIGPWAAVAYAAARGADPMRAIADEDAQPYLDAAPLEVLELDATLLGTLRALGVRTVGALRALDPVELGDRLGPEAARARRRAEGDDPRLPATPRERTSPRVEVRLEDELDSVEPLLFLLRPALAQLLRDPCGRGEGITELVVTLARERGAPIELRVRSAHPIGEVDTLLELVRARLDADPSPTGTADARDFLVGFDVTAIALAPLGDRTRALFGEAWRDPAAREVALARLASRFGAEALRRATRVETASPLARAAWTHSTPARGHASPWREQVPPAPVRDGEVEVAGRRRRICRLGRIERALAPWWHDGALRVERLAWAELEGPLLVLLRERRDVDPPRWEAVAWID